jgi:uncharacterized sulfatase
MQINRENQMIRIPLQWLTACVLGALIAAPSIALAETPKQPNIVLLISDDDDYEHFGFMGSKIAHTPTLDKLAAAGTLFTTAYCPAAVCRPSLASILAGRLPHQHGIYSNRIVSRSLGKDSITLNPNGSLPNRLKDAGYATFISGKYWEGDPQAMGFTHGDMETKSFSSFVRKGQEELFRFIDDQRDSNPMFIWWAPKLPHSPHNPAQKYFERFENAEIPIPSFYSGDREKYVNEMRKFYAMGTWFDDGVAQLIAKLKAAGEYEDTLFLFYIDNGYTYGLPAKSSPTDKGLRTPLFVTWPGQVPAGKRIDSLNYALDLHATALDYAGVEVPTDIASKSLRPQIEGEVKEHEVIYGSVHARLVAFYKRDSSIKRSAQRDLFALVARTQRWKYILYTQDLTEENDAYIGVGHNLSDPVRRRKGEQELFDLDADPYEQSNLALSAEHREQVAQFQAGVLDWWKRTGGGPLNVATGSRGITSPSTRKSKTTERGR